MCSEAVAVARQIGIVLGDISTSDWLRNALRTALDRDAVDAAMDAEILAKLLADRAEVVIDQALSESDCGSPP